MTARFRIRPEHLDEVIEAPAGIGIEPLRVYDRDDGAIAVEIADPTDAQGHALAVKFKPELSAIIGVVGGGPWQTMH